jgi:Kef-type K+ transport system membrane component KefB
MDRGMSVLMPMAFGVGAAALLYDRYAPPGVGFPVFALFMASAMSITAFPIMARILKERGMTHTVIGRLWLSSAAMADVTGPLLTLFAGRDAAQVSGATDTTARP